MSSELVERLATELELLRNMYPDHIEYQPKGRELNFKVEYGTLRIRLPDGYLDDALPEILSASVGNTDVRNKIKMQIAELSIGEEILDSIIMSFSDLVESEAVDKSSTATTNTATEDTRSCTTMIVWLHHLLNTNKRKQCLALSSPHISGVTKPGYPGVLVYSGLSKLVHEHVNELKSLNWAGFQIRLEEDEAWKFKHGYDVIEVESMAEVVAEIDVEPGRKDMFLEAMKMK